MAKGRERELETDDLEHADVVIVGARLAGTATAVPLVRAGLKVVVLDKVSFPSDTMSTHAMVPSAVQELLLMGALDRVLALDPARSRFLAIHEDGVRFRERFTPFLGIDYGLCVPRNLLDKELVDAARSSGVDVRERCGVEQVLWENDRPVGVVYRSGGSRRAIQARVIVGADGRKSRMAAEFGVWEPYRGSKNGRGFAFRYLDDPLGPDGQEEYGVYRYGTTISLILPSCPRGRALAVHMCDASEIPEFRSDPENMWRSKIDADRAWGERIGGATNLSAIRATDNLSSYYRASSGPGWALVGDAGHFKDPVTGNGQRDALKHGRLLGEAIATTINDPMRLDHALRQWERNRDRDTVSTYHWGNRETRPVASSTLVKCVISGFADNPGEEPRFSDTFNRVRPVEHVLNPRRLATGLIQALCTPGVDRRALVAEILTELPHELDIRRHRLLGGFRSTRVMSTERPGWSVGSAPSSGAGQDVRRHAGATTG
ncbi:NAD(P)/FAD-dependent oxidoreductase [Gordonia sp. N1V]|uniref:NAD(P)/FAD-dependent oxidoreductase n=1 Tax=Gordonia sp. N1V TaxID=3034163 RepID=UPI0023E0D5F1|nr:NAD(P)/FAD-dependent oxidoreductase [Gordonia sp. N1V]MDF3285516.1 NAD(P)/FAD-dependent oxidoreductase [Gordonia sp. N1V]